MTCPGFAVPRSFSRSILAFHARAFGGAFRRDGFHAINPKGNRDGNEGRDDNRTGRISGIDRRGRASTMARLRPLRPCLEVASNSRSSALSGLRDAAARRRGEHERRPGGGVSAMNTQRCLSCGDPLGITTRSDRRTCSDLCRKRLSLARRAERAAPGAQRAREAAMTSPRGHLPTSRRSRDKRGPQS